MIHSVDDCRVPGVLFQSTQACFTKMPTQVVALLVTEFAERQEALAHCGDVRLLAGNRVAEGHGHRIRNAPRPFDEIATALERKDGTPELIHPDRHDRTLRSAGDEFVATLEPQQDAGTREFALRKDADDLAAPDEFRGFLDRVLRPFRRDRQSVSYTHLRAH